jgi:chromosome segregation ATPase
MLLSRLRVIFENAAGEVELWSKSVLAPLDHQLRERRGAFQKRRETLERIEGASGELEQRIQEVEGGEQRLQQQLGRFDQLVVEVEAAIADPASGPASGAVRAA